MIDQNVEPKECIACESEAAMLKVHAGKNSHEGKRMCERDMHTRQMHVRIENAHAANARAKGWTAWTTEVLTASIEESRECGIGSGSGFYGRSVSSTRRRRRGHERERKRGEKHEGRKIVVRSRNKQVFDFIGFIRR